MDEKLITEEVLEEAETAFKSHFKPEARFERQVVFSTHHHINPRERGQSTQQSRVVKRATASVLAESILCKTLGWDLLSKANLSLYTFGEIVDLIREMSNAYEDKLWVDVGAVTKTELELLTPFVQGITATIGSVNKDIQRRVSPNTPLTTYMSMFNEARTMKHGMSITLGLGEKLDDMEELARFIETHQIDRVLFRPFKPRRASRYFKEPSSFYCARWIAETRIRFPKLTIVAGTNEHRVAETGLFLKAGANTITNFPSIRLFNSEQARIIEEEIRNAGRVLKGTLTDMRVLNKVRESRMEDHIKEKLEKYIMAMSNASR